MQTQIDFDSKKQCDFVELETHHLTACHLSCSCRRRQNYSADHLSASFFHLPSLIGLFANDKNNGKTHWTLVWPTRKERHCRHSSRNRPGEVVGFCNQLTALVKQKKLRSFVWMANWFPSWLIVVLQLIGRHFVCSHVVAYPTSNINIACSMPPIGTGLNEVKKVQLDSSTKRQARWPQGGATGPTSLSYVGALAIASQSIQATNKQSDATTRRPFEIAKH